MCVDEKDDGEDRADLDLDMGDDDMDLEGDEDGGAGVDFMNVEEEEE